LAGGYKVLRVMEEKEFDVKRLLIWFVAGVLLFVAFETMIVASGDDASIDTDQPVLIQFYSDRCIACRAMEPVMKEIIRECDGKGIKIEQLNVSDPNVRRMASRFHIRGVPTFVFFDELGREYARLIGIQSKSKIKRLINKLNGNRCSDHSTSS